MKLDKVNLGKLASATPHALPIPEYTPKKEDKKKKKGGFWDKVWSKGKLKKPNMVAVMYLRNNGMAEPMEVQVREGFFNIYGRTYHENRDCIWSLTKDRTPFAIIPEWSLIPIGTKRWEDKPMLEKFAELQDHTLRGIRHAEFVRLGDGKGLNLNAKSIIGFIILGIIAIAIAAQYLG